MKSKLFKKIIAGIASLTMLASLTIVPVTVEAATDLYSQDFETDTTVNYTTALGGNSSERIQTNTAGNETSFYNVYTSGAGGNREETFTFDAAYGAGLPVKFSMLLRAMGSNTNGGEFQIRDSANNSFFTLAFTSYFGSPTINGESVTMTGAKVGGSLGASDYNASGWLKIEATIDFRSTPALVNITVTDITNSNAVVYEGKYTTTATNINKLYGSIGRSNGAFAYDDILIQQLTDEELPQATTYTVTYSVSGTESKEVVEENDLPQEVPDTTKTGYIFQGWAKDGDTDNLLSTDEIAETPVTADVTYTAVYEKDPDYIEPIVSAVISGAESMTIGADADTAAANEYTVTLTGELGTVITKDTLDSRIEDFSITWDVEGFKTENDIDTYCDSYGEFESNVTDDVTAVFNVKDSAQNFFGLMKATVTYNGETVTASKAVAAIANTDVPANQILPKAGYPSDIADYSEALNGYETTGETYGNSSDVITGDWIMAGSDTSKGAVIVRNGDEGYMRVSGGTLKKSHVVTNKISSPTTQAIFEQDVRFNSTGGMITFTAGYPIWSSASSYGHAIEVDFDGTNISLNGTAVSKDDTAVAFNSGTWYKLVLSVDKTNETAFVNVYSTAGELLGTTGNVAWGASCSPVWYSIGMGNSYTGTIDFNNYTAYYPAADESTFAIVATQDTLSIPNGDTAELTASLKTTEGYDFTGAATWTVLEEDMQAGVIVAPDETDSHKAVVTLADGAAAGEATVQVNISGYTKTVVLNITSSAESVKFTESKTSVSIPLDTTKTETAQFSAIVIDGEGNDLERDVTLAVYDKTNTEEITLPAGITFDTETGALAVTADAKAYTFVIRATGTNTDGEIITKAVKVTVHGLEFDFGAGTDEDVVEGNTAVTPDTSYTEARGYGITGTVTAGGTASTDDATTDYLEGAMTFKANVQAGKIYTVEITYQGVLSAEPVNSDLTAYSLGTQTELATATYTIPVIDDVLELVIADGDATAQIASIVITKNADKTANTIPTIHHIGDSTSANNGSWAYVLNNTYGSYDDFAKLATFSNRGAGGRNLSSYYTEGKLASVLNSIKPGDILMFGNMGTNGTGNCFEDDVNYYLDAAEALGAKIIINSYTPHGAVGNYTGGYDSATQTFTSYRTDGYDKTVRAIAEERAANDENYLGFVDIGKRADASFNAYVDDYATNGYESRDAAAQAIIACFPDHNHYHLGSIARDLMLNGYGDTEGIVAGIVDILSDNNEEPDPTPIKVTFEVENAVVTIDGADVTSTYVEEGDEVSFTVTPADGYEVTSVKVGEDELTAKDGVYTITVNADTTVTVTTAEKQLPPTPEYGIAYADGVITILTDKSYESVNVYVVTYNTDDSLTSVKLVPVTLTADEVETVEMELTEGTKVMLWNGVTPIFDVLGI